MIICPLDPARAGSDEFVDAWPIVERLQREHYASCWMITQPSHAALAGEIAAKLTGAQTPQLEPSIVRAIALHDAGWGAPDAQAIMHSRARPAQAPKSFLQTAVDEFLAAWVQSIEISLKQSPIGGYMVSRHFWRLAEHHLAHGNSGEPGRRKIQRFAQSESARQKKLLSQTGKTAGELEVLTDVLQFCDLISLYICSGAQQPVQLPEYFGVRPRLKVEGAVYRLEPALVESGSQFSVAALRFPVIKGESSREIQVKID
jgi:hypothetical protein